MIDVAIADDHSIVRAGFRQFISSQVDMRVVAEATSGREALDIARRGACHVLLLDISMPDQSGVDTLRAIRLAQRELPVLMLSGFAADKYATSLLKMGANGYLSKDCEPQELVDAIRVVARGRSYISPQVGELLAQGLGKRDDSPAHEALSDRELQVFLRLAQGETVSDIAESLHVSVKTVSTYRARVLEKLNQRTNSDLTYYALQHGLIQ